MQENDRDLLILWNNHSARFTTDTDHVVGFFQSHGFWTKTCYYFKSLRKVLLVHTVDKKKMFTLTSRCIEIIGSLCCYNRDLMAPSSSQVAF